MKEIDKEKFQKTVAQAQVQFWFTYWGKSNNMRVGCKWGDKAVDLDRLTDEQVVLLWQLVNSALNMLAREQIKRDLLPEELKKLYAEAEKPEESE